ncbi:MAG: acyltransferase [Plesiomonas sp.]|uniref:acyltransferase n=1 Tax=Plesiomonas sp. TaxID=2486279 RepID=UPI003F2BB55C
MVLVKYLLTRNLVKIKSNGKVSCLGRVRNSVIKVYGINNEVLIHKNANLRGCEIHIKGENNKLIIGAECDLQKTTILMDNNGGVITIGDKTSIGKSMLVSFENYPITIGAGCMISYDVEIRNTDSHSVLLKDSGCRVNYGKPVFLSDRVWVGCGSMIMKGSRIGADSIIGAKSLVSGDIPEYCIAVGSPAKPVKKGVCWKRELVE